MAEMKITMFVTEDAIQFNLDPESEHEKSFLGLFDKFNGEVRISRGADLNICQGNYIRNFGYDHKITAITISKPVLKG
jgi:hypothetical protein